MKKLLVTAIVAVTSVAAWAQGTVNFANYLTGTTPQILAATRNSSGVLLGNTYAADLFFGSPGSDPTTWTSVGLASLYRMSGTPAVGNGRLTAQEVVIPGFAGGANVGVQIRAWRLSDGATWAQAYANNGEVSPATAPTVVVTLGNPLSNPPGVPTDLIDVNTGLALVGHNLVIVPEPATILLGLAGIGGLFFLRRKMA